MNAVSNRRNGLKHEGRVRRWLIDEGLRCLNLASNAEGDLLVYDHADHTHLLEVKRVTGSPFAYYPAKNPKQRDRLAKIPRTYYAVSFYGLRPNEAPVTRFCASDKLPLAIRPDSGVGWDEFLRRMKGENVDSS